MAIMDAFLQELEHEAISTRKMLERVPGDALAWKPHEKSMTLGRLAGHVAEIPGWAVETLTKDELNMDGSYKPPEMKTAKDILQLFDQNLASARGAMQGVADGALMRLWTFQVYGKEVFKMPKVVVLRSFVFSHLIHHRGQLSVYLRLKNVPLPQTYGPSADESGF